MSNFDYPLSHEIVLIVFISKNKFAMFPITNDPEMLPYTSDKAKLFAENFSKSSNLGDSGICLPSFTFFTSFFLTSF